MRCIGRHPKRQAAERKDRPIGGTAAGCEAGQVAGSAARPPAGGRETGARLRRAAEKVMLRPTDFLKLLLPIRPFAARFARRGAARKSRPRASEPPRSAVCNPLPPSAPAVTLSPRPFRQPAPPLIKAQPKHGRNSVEPHLPAVYCQRCGAVFGRL